MTVNGEYIQGDICSRTCLDYRDCSNSKRFIFTFSDVSDDTYEIRELSFRILDNMGYHSIDTIEPKGDFVETAAWPYSTAFFSHEIEYGHVSGDEYYPIFNGSTENFISIDSIQSGTYFGHFQISLARDTSVSKLISTSEDTLYITKGHFSLRNFVR